MWNVCVSLNSIIKHRLAQSLSDSTGVQSSILNENHSESNLNKTEQGRAVASTVFLIKTKLLYKPTASYTCISWHIQKLYLNAPNPEDTSDKSLG